MAKLTDGKSGTIARTAAPAKGQRLIFDDHRDAPRGFALRLTAAGGKAFILRYASPTKYKERRITVGDWPTWSLEAARAEAGELRKLVDKGIDPLDMEKERREAPTVSAALADYKKRHVKGLASEKAINGYFKRDLEPRIGEKKVRDVCRRDIIEIVEDKAVRTPTAASRLLAYTKGFFDWCVDREYIEHSPAAGIKPKSIKRAGKKSALAPVKRKRILDSDEIRAFWGNAERCGMMRITALALKLILVTGQRPGEVAGLHESELESESMWVIPASRRLKTETDHRVPLTALAQQIIQQAREEVSRLQKRRKGERAGCVFEIRQGMPLQGGGLSKAVARYTAELENKAPAGWGFWTPHDLRRTCRTGLSACGFPAEVAERVIGHAAKGIEDVYNQHDYDWEKRAALTAWERRLHAILAGEGTGQEQVAMEAWERRLQIALAGEGADQVRRAQA